MTSMHANAAQPASEIPESANAVLCATWCTVDHYDRAPVTDVTDVIHESNPVALQRSSPRTAGRSPLGSTSR
jgi:hypothetical protein